MVPKEKVIHFPWAVPDQFVQQEEIRTRRNGEVSIFGGSSSEAYDFRNWCRAQDGLVSYGNSGVENKVFSDQDYYSWLQKLDAVVAAGSFSSKYQMVTPKYFEILASGCLLIGQYCSDYKHLNIGPTNSLHFSTKEEFLKCVKNYKESPEDYIDIRNEGRRLIQSHHTISKRMEIIDELYKKSL